MPIEIGTMEIIAIVAGAFIGLIVGNWAFGQLEKRFGDVTSTIGAFFSGLLALLVVASLVSPAIGQATGLRAKPKKKKPKAKPEKEAFALVSVTDQYAEPTQAIQNGKVRILASEPKPGESVVKLTGVENTNSDGAACLKVAGVYPGLEAWTSATKSGYYPDKKRVVLTETKAPERQVALQLADQGSWDIDLIAVTNGDNIATEAVGDRIENIKVDVGVDVVFDLYVRNAESESAIRDIQQTNSRGDEFGNLDGFKCDVYKAEGVEASLVSGDMNLSAEDEGTMNYEGDLVHLKDIVMRVEIDQSSSNASGDELATIDLNDLLDETGIHGVTGLASATISITVA